MIDACGHPAILDRRRYWRTDPIYSLLLTFGLALIIADVVRTIQGAQGVLFETPTTLDSPIRSSQARRDCALEPR